MTQSSQAGDADALDRRDVATVRRGDVDAFAAIVERHQRRAFALALMIVRDPFGAEEAAQDAFVRAFRHLARYDDTRPFYPWLATIVVHASQNRRQVLQRHRTREAGAPDPEGHLQRASDSLEDLIADERGKQLWRAVSRLPEGERTATLLHYRQGLSVEEAARVLGVTAGTVKTFLFRARQRLKQLTGEAT